MFRVPVAKMSPGSKTIADYDSAPHCGFRSILFFLGFLLSSCDHGLDDSTNISLAQEKSSTIETSTARLLTAGKGDIVMYSDTKVFSTVTVDPQVISLLGLTQDEASSFSNASGSIVSHGRKMGIKSISSASGSSSTGPHDILLLEHVSTNGRGDPYSIKITAVQGEHAWSQEITREKGSYPVFEGAEWISRDIMLKDSIAFDRAQLVDRLIEDIIEIGDSDKDDLDKIGHGKSEQ